jgi:hypothetical protein
VKGQDRVNAYKQKDSGGDKNLADNVECYVGLVLRDHNAECESQATSHAKSKAQCRVEKLHAIRMEQPVKQGKVGVQCISIRGMDTLIRRKWWYDIPKMEVDAAH